MSNKRILKESVERQLRSAIPLMSHNIHEASIGKWAKAIAGGVGSLGAELGHRMKAAAVNQWTATAQHTHEYSQAGARELLHHHYGEHLELKPSYISMVMNDYQKTMPRKPQKNEPVLHPATGLPQYHPPTHQTATGIVPHPLAGQMITQPNAQYGMEMREYDTKRAEYLEREKLLNRIQGLHKAIPTLGRFADTAQSASSQAKATAQSNWSQRQATKSANRADTYRRTRKWTP
jgi:hypothetical protein